MKSFQKFINESKDRYDREGTAIGGGGSSHRGGDKIGYDRKKQEKSLPSPHSKGDKPKARVKAIGGGKTAPAKDYKDRKDIGTNKPKSRTQQQPTKERGSAKLSPREQQKKARAERLAAKSGGKSKKELTKAADKLLSKKSAKKVDPNYKPAKASGYTRIERQKIRRAGQRLVKDIQKGKEKPISNYNPKV